MCVTDARPGVGILENRRRETTMSDKKWIKAEDVARLAGVSRSAVSRTFTPGASVSEKTRQKVLSAAEALGYQVNIIARTMITGSSNFIASSPPVSTTRFAANYWRRWSISWRSMALCRC